MSTDAILNAAIQYANRGWRVVPLRAKDKKPWLPEWQHAASTDEDTIIRWWEKTPASNVGVQLGQASGIIDIEGDESTSEAEIAALFGGTIPPCPMFKSYRSTHRLFAWSDRLPGGAVVHIGAVEIRTGNGGRGAQTVFPPSVHQSGITYQWLEGCDPDSIDPPTIHPDVLGKIWNLAGEETAIAKASDKPAVWRELFSGAGVPEGKRDNTLLSFASHEARLSPNIEDPQEQGYLYIKIVSLNTLCSPPLPEEDLRRIHQQAINYTRRDLREDSRAGFTVHGLRFENGLWLPGDWKLTIILSDPVEYALHVPAWKELTNDGEGVVHLDVDEFRAADKVAAKVQAATRVIVLDDVPRVWPAIWNGTLGNKKEQRQPCRGLKAILIDAAERVKPAATEQRYITVAEMFQAEIGQARSAGDEDNPDPRRPVIRADGTIWFRWNELWSEAFQFRLVERKEVSSFARRVGILPSDYRIVTCANRASGGGKNRLRFCVLQPKHLARLTEIIADGD